MAIPTVKAFIPIILKLAKDGMEHSTTEACTFCADTFKLTIEEQQQRIPSGDHKVYKHRVTWAIHHLKQANLIQSTSRGQFKITPHGMESLQQNDTKKK